MRDTKKYWVVKLFISNRSTNFILRIFWKNARFFILLKKTLFKTIKNCRFRPKNARYEKMLRSKIVNLRKIYKFYFHHFLVKRAVFVLSIKNGFYKIKKSIFWPNYARYEKMLRSKIIYLRKIYKFYFHHFLVKRTVFVLSIKTVFYKMKKFILRLNYARYEITLRNKIILFKNIYKFNFNYFLVKRTVFVLSINNVFYKIKKSILRPNIARYEIILRNKIILFKKIYKFGVDHFLIKSIFKFRKRLDTFDHTSFSFSSLIFRRFELKVYSI